MASNYVIHTVTEDILLQPVLACCSCSALEEFMIMCYINLTYLLTIKYLTDTIYSKRFIIMVALCNRADHYNFALWFLLLLFFPHPISAAVDWMSTIIIIIIIIISYERQSNIIVKKNFKVWP